MFGKNCFAVFNNIHILLTYVGNKPGKVFFTCMFLLSVFGQSVSAQVIHITDQSQSALISSHLEQLVDSGKISTVSEIYQSPLFVKSRGHIPVFPNSVKSVWFRFSIRNDASSASLLLNIAYPNLSRVSLYRVDSGNTVPVLIGEEGNEISSKQKISGSPNLIFDLGIKKDATQQYLLHVNSEHPIIVPGEIHTYDAIHKSINLQIIVSGLYLGVLGVMFLYNLFLFYGTKDNNYLYYIIYIFFLAVAQTTAAGYEFRYVWNGYPWLNKYAVVVSSSLSALSGLLFSMHFLRTSFYTKKLHIWLNILFGVYIVGIICGFFSLLSISYNILNFNGLVSVVSVLTTCVVIARKGFRPAYFYLIAWLLL